ncbi:MAG: protein kinase [Pseudomonadota bacterium]
MAEIFRTALSNGAEVHWYQIEAILGQGGFGITYLARDTNLGQRVAIKEYFPAQLATRLPDSSVSSSTSRLGETYNWGLKGFVEEAKRLFPIRHPNIVQVHSVFEENNTAYMVMDYHEGQTLADELERAQPAFSEQELLELVLPLVDGLGVLHEHKVIHRDIKPANVIRGSDGPVLIDFGSARYAFGLETHTLTCLVSPGFAPFEQYSGAAKTQKQGAWSDIYALAATLYTTITGELPVDAATRVSAIIGGESDPLSPLTEIARDKYSRHFLEAIDRALEFHPHDRPETAAAWAEMLCGNEAARASASRRRLPNRPPTGASRSATAEARLRPTPPERALGSMDALTNHESGLGFEDTRTSEETLDYLLDDTDTAIDYYADTRPATRRRDGGDQLPVPGGQVPTHYHGFDTATDASFDELRPRPSWGSGFGVRAMVIGSMMVGAWGLYTVLTSNTNTPLNAAAVQSDVGVAIPQLPTSKGLSSPQVVPAAATAQPKSLAELERERDVKEELLKIERARAQQKREDAEFEQRRIEEEKERLQQEAKPEQKKPISPKQQRAIDKARVELAQLRQQFTDEHPDVIAAKRRLRVLRQAH